MTKHQKETHPSDRPKHGIKVEHRDGNKYCRTCDTWKPLDEFNNRKLSWDGKNSKCKLCHRSETRRWAKENPDQRRKQAKIHNEKMRKQVLEAYGSACACCGETEPEFLSIDHINGDGAELRRKNPRHKDNLYRWLRQNNFPKDNYQLLCINCNWSKGTGPNGECVHARKAKLELQWQ